MEKKKHTGISIKPEKVAIGSKVFAIADLTGVTARTVKERLEKEGVEVTNKWANAFVEQINKKGE